MSDEVEDILGPPSKHKKPRLKPVPPKKPRSALVQQSASANPAADILGGVTIFWLAKAFGMEVSTVRKRLADCPPMARRTSGFLYSLPVAAQYLVKPRVDLQHYLEGLKPIDLPQQLQGPYWDAQIKRQKFETMMKELWHSEDVMAVFGEVFKAVKFSIQLWPDTLERATGFSDEDRELLVTLADAMQDQIYGSIVRLSQEKGTPSALVRFEDAVKAPNTVLEIEENEVEDIL